MILRTHPMPTQTQPIFTKKIKTQCDGLTSRLDAANIVIFYANFEFDKTSHFDAYNYVPFDYYGLLW